MTLRPVRKEDMELLFAWTNDPAVRRNSFQTDLIPLADHQRWFGKKILSDCVAFYIMEVDGIPAGQVRYEVEGEEALTNYSVAKEYRGRGFGAAMIVLAQERLLADFPGVKKITALVKSQNQASANIFRRLGYYEETASEASAPECRFVKHM